MGKINHQFSSAAILDNKFEFIPKFQKNQSNLDFFIQDGV